MNYQEAQTQADQNDLVLVVGLEVHAELATQTKMFCNSKNDPDEPEPNIHVCPVCMGHPGTLPVINQEAVKKVLSVGAAVSGELNQNFTEFDRKNYFYPDIPKGYQISQYKYPLVSGGSLAGVAVTRIHLEEDTAQSTHHDADKENPSPYSLVNFNRAGVPLMELVTEPVIRSSEQAGNFARELQLLLRTLGVSHANMQKGEMRVEANISVGRRISDDKIEFGTKVEVKNLNSFKAAESAIEFEEARHRGLIADGKGDQIVQETRGWDENKQQTFSQRKKEGSADYRYFPEPDLPKLVLKDVPDLQAHAIREALPELPGEKRSRYQGLGVSGQNADTLVQEAWLGAIYDEAHVQLIDPGTADLLSNYVTSDLVALHRTHVIEGDLPSSKVTAPALAQLINLVATNKLSSRGAKDLLGVLFVDGGSDAEAIAQEKNFLQVSDSGAIESLAAEIIAENEDVVSEVKAGKEAGLKFLIGQGMKKSRGSINPGLLQKELTKQLSS